MDGDGFVLEGTHDGFAHLPGGPRHVRRLTARPGEVVIEDRVLGGGHSGRGGMLLHPGCKVSAGGGGVVRLAHDGVGVTVASTTPLTVEDAVWSPDLYQALPTRRLAFDVPPGPEGVTIRLRRDG
jgi:hypothetical protein